ncbi:MAG TPA: nuclear transport factor 2 family protein [Longimicrobiales bacterium]
MKGSSMMGRAAGLFVALAVIPARGVEAQSASDGGRPDSLYATIAALDSAMFEAYNRCELDRLATFFDDDLEFYHDQTGLSVGRDALIEGVLRNVCGKVHRDLVPGSLEIHPLHGFGAVATGTHRFCDARRYAHCFNAGGPARFVTLWRRTDAGWKVTRVISYDHH